jgi:hypothetical protein
MVHDSRARQSSKATENLIYFVIPNEVRNLSLVKRKKREIPRRAARLGMTKISVFPQTVQHVILWLRSAPQKSKTRQAEACPTKIDP